MLGLKLVALVASLLVTSSQAGGSEDGSGWGSTSAAACPTVTTTQWSVSTQWVPTTITDYVPVTSTQNDYITTTETDYVTISTTEKNYITVTNTATSYISVTTTDTVTKVSVSVQPTTIVNTATSYVTVTTTETKISVSVQPTTIVNTATSYISVTATETQVSFSVQPTTIVNTATSYISVIQTNTEVNTVTQVSVQPTTVIQATTIVQPTTVSRTITSINLSTITSTVATTITSTNVVSTCPSSSSSSSSLSGLVTCTSRIVNPTYTPPAPLPTNYLWGCPPGTICTPPQIGCNFEQNPPAENYTCSPDECKPVPPLPTITDWDSLWPSPTQDCAWENPNPGYFNLNPEYFGLTFAIFNVDGQAACPVSATSTLTGWEDWETAKPKPTGTPKMPRRGLMRDSLTDIVRRQGSLNSAPAQCYMVFDTTSNVAERDGYVCDTLCAPNGDFLSGVTSCRSCAANAQASETTVNDFPPFNQFFVWCQKHCPS